MQFPEGYEGWDGFDAFEDMIGPMKFTRAESGQMKTAFISEDKHCNGGGMLHGGMLMSFADFSLFGLARDHLNGDHAVTISFNSEFVAAVGAGHFIECDGNVTRATRSGLIFITGRVFTGDKTLLTFSGIIKKLNS